MLVVAQAARRLVLGSSGGGDGPGFGLRVPAQSLPPIRRPREFVTMKTRESVANEDGIPDRRNGVSG
jgi:hypothetical protein